MKNKLKSVKMGSKSAASPQSKDRGNPVYAEMARVGADGAAGMSGFDAQGELENAVYQAIGCIFLLNQCLERKIVEDSKNVADLTAAGVVYVSESASERLLTAFRSKFGYKKPAPSGSHLVDNQ